MRMIEVIQNDPEWFQARKGIPTSSSFKKIVTPLGAYSAQADAYADLLCAEIVLGRPLETFGKSDWMERGNALEYEAGLLYEMMFDEQIERAGFCIADNGLYGASPDRFISKRRGGLEIKCVAPWTHVTNLLKETIDKDHRPQTQGQMLVCDFEYVDWFSYHPEMPPQRIRTVRDEAYIKILSDSLNKFSDTMQAKMEKLIQKGCSVPEKKKETDLTNVLMAG